MSFIRTTVTGYRAAAENEKKKLNPNWMQIHIVQIT